MAFLVSFEIDFPSVSLFFHSVTRSGLTSNVQHYTAVKLKGVSAVAGYYMTRKIAICFAESQSTGPLRDGGHFHPFIIHASLCLLGLQVVISVAK